MEKNITPPFGPKMGKFGLLLRRLRSTLSRHIDAPKAVVRIGKSRHSRSYADSIRRCLNGGRGYGHHSTEGTQGRESDGYAMG